MIVICILSFLFIMTVGYQVKCNWQRFHVWHWKRQLQLDEHFKTLQTISAPINGFELSKIARSNNDAMEYVYGEVDTLSFIALLSLTQPDTSTVFYDLGSGTGKTVLACAMVFNVKKSCGIELFEPLDQAANAQLQQLRVSPIYQPTADTIQFVCGDFLTTPFDDATLIFISATALFGESWQRLNHHIDSLVSSPIIITTTKPLMSSYYTVIRQTKIQMSWGVVSAFIQTRVI